MKALKSELASELLADPKTRDQLRRLVTNRPGSAGAQQLANGRISIQRERGGSVTAVFVPKAKTA